LIHIIPILRDNYCYLIEGSDKECIIVDPGEVKSVEQYIHHHGLKPVLILNTHHHADHVAGNNQLKKIFCIDVCGPKAEDKMIPAMDIGVSEGDVIIISGINLSVIETPGHTKGHVIFHWQERDALLCGDTLFSMGCGRLIESGPADMFASLQKIKALKPETMIYCGHEYTEANGAFALSEEPDNEAVQKRLSEAKKMRQNNQPTIPVSLGSELETNLFLRAKSLNEFAGLRARKDQF
jgi:hydroxyacylglutathione hydrolase